ncbi:hypothetical protein JOJ87_001175 [Rhodococcus ruber]|uniref:hypothetical protein n=1 Tax=Rhodococcus ruber TaxID=1830 RepID=UPI001AE89F2F|nr:hypothetical protein [Rhodococcus ruber]MBP2210831.1 hypothetical protein [Rhodococcus ruber]
MVGELRADVARLEELSGRLHGLAAEASRLRVGPAAGPYAPALDALMPSVLEAARLSQEIVDSALIPALAERLGETGDVMRATAREYRNQDDTSATRLVSAYLSATGDWRVDEDPA